MRRIKNWFKSIMGQEKFGSLSILSIGRDIANLIDIRMVVNNFLNKDRHTYYININ